MRSHRLKKRAARCLLALLLALWMCPAALAAEGDGYYTLSTEGFSQFTWQASIDGKPIENFGGKVLLNGDETVTLTGTISAENGDYLGGSSAFLVLDWDPATPGALSQRWDALRLDDGTYFAISPIRETLRFEDLRLTADGSALTYRFSFEGEYDAVPVTYAEVTAENDLWPSVDTTAAERITVRGSGYTAEPTPLTSSLAEAGGSTSWNIVVSSNSGLQTSYTVERGGVEQPLGMTSWNGSTTDPAGQNQIWEGLSLRLASADASDAIPGVTVPGAGGNTKTENTTPVKVAATAAAAAVGAAAVSAAAGASASPGSLLQQAVYAAADDPVILINGGAVCPKLANTEKATAELPLIMESGGGQIYHWNVMAISPDCMGAVTATAVPPVGEHSAAVLMLKGKPLPKQSVSVFLRVSAAAPDGQTVTASVELTLCGKGLYAVCKDHEHPLLPESYTVTRISDANLDGIAEEKQLSPSEYTVAITSEGTVITVGEETILLPLED